MRPGRDVTLEDCGLFHSPHENKIGCVLHSVILDTVHVPGGPTREENKVNLGENRWYCACTTQAEVGMTFGASICLTNGNREASCTCGNVYQSGEEEDDAFRVVGSQDIYISQKYCNLGPNFVIDNIACRLVPSLFDLPVWRRSTRDACMACPFHQLLKLSPGVGVHV